MKTGVVYVLFLPIYFINLLALHVFFDTTTGGAKVRNLQILHIFFALMNILGSLFEFLQRFNILLYMCVYPAAF